MEQAHINFVRVGEFAWSTMEPQEGTFDLDWLAHAIRAAEKHHIAVVLGTPSAAPTRMAHPEVPRDPPHHGRRPQGRPRQPAAV